MPASFRILALLALSGLLLPAAGCGSAFFYPERKLVWNPAQDNIPYRDIRFASEDRVPLHGWLMCPRAEAPRGTILFLHGNAENVSTHSRAVLWLVEAGYEVFTFDYRGYGLSGGEPDIPGVHRDAKAAVGQLLSLRGASADRYVVFGQSIGGSIAVYTVATLPPERKPRALIVDSAFAGYRRIFREKMKSFLITWPFAWPASVFLEDGYSPARWIDKAGPGPVIVIHGTADGIVPYEHGKELYERARDPKGIWTIEGGGHISGLRNAEVRAQFLAFLEAWIPAGSGGACAP
ncbi:MAG: alpha/beta hydrolase [Thermodesulfobacteriota bacterium]